MQKNSIGSPYPKNSEKKIYLMHPPLVHQQDKLFNHTEDFAKEIANEFIDLAKKCKEKIPHLK